MLFRESFGGVLGVFWGCFGGVLGEIWGFLVEFWGCFGGVLREFWGCFGGVLGVFWGSFVWGSIKKLISLISNNYKITYHACNQATGRRGRSWRRRRSWRGVCYAMWMVR